MSTAEIEARIIDLTQRIRRAWARPDAPVSREAMARRFGPSVPLDGAWLVRRGAVEELAFWVRAADSDGLAVVVGGIDLGDPDAMASHLRDHARALTGWEFAERLVGDLARLAGALEALTRDPEPPVLLGECPTVDAEGVECGGKVRASVESLADVRCPRCGRVEDVDTWQRLMVEVEHVTAEVLSGILRERLGVRLTAAGIRQRASRGTIPAAVGKDEAGFALYDVRATLAAVIEREAVA